MQQLNIGGLRLQAYTKAAHMYDLTATRQPVDRKRGANARGRAIVQGDKFRDIIIIATMEEDYLQTLMQEMLLR